MISDCKGGYLWTLATHWLWCVSHLKFQYAVWEFPSGVLSSTSMYYFPICHMLAGELHTTGLVLSRTVRCLARCLSGCARSTLTTVGACSWNRVYVIPPFMLSWARRWHRACWYQFCVASLVTVGIVYWVYKTHHHPKCYLINSLKMSAHLSSVKAAVRTAQ